MRSEFYSLSTETAQNQFVIDYLKHHSDSSKSVESILFTIAGKSVCQQCWRLVYGIKYTRFKTILEKFRQGIVQVEHGLLGRKFSHGPVIRAKMWLHMFITKLGDQMPTDGKIHLPSCLTKSDIFELASEDLSVGGVSVCSKSSFFELWKKEFQHVKIPPVSM